MNIPTMMVVDKLSRPNAQSGWPRNECSALGQNVRPTEVSAKVQTVRPITHHDPGNIVPRSAKPQRHATPRTTMPREPGTSLAAAQPSRVPRPMVRAVPRPAEKPSAKFHPVRPPADRNHPATTVPTRPRPDCPADVPTDRPNAAVDPKPFLKPNPHNSSPKPAPT
ncbi:unnamed protein product [Microthlaspi erraticum]|uniref:Uncharacterized protein n=1 Tax=Microthlaspi erraticum TaxID=1685480 RepID=A0A6D2JTX4_9BRAS|nr:unnamed protein product [Microthlaspi erraticum]